MYVPKAFEVSDQATLREFIAKHSFATVMSQTGDGLFASQVPLILDSLERKHPRLAGHFARANPHWKSFDGKREVLSIFSGPHAYISPTWYTVSPAVPTWNYATVHVYGRARVIDDAAWMAGLLDRMIAIYESPMAEPWPGILPADFRERLIEKIVGFVIEIDRMEGKFKLGQNRSREDQESMLHNLEQSPDPIARELAIFSRRYLGGAESGARETAVSTPILAK